MLKSAQNQTNTLFASKQQEEKQTVVKLFVYFIVRFAIQHLTYTFNGKMKKKWTPTLFLLRQKEGG